MKKRDESHEEINDLALVWLVRNILVIFANLATVMVTVNTTDDEDDDDDEVICVWPCDHYLWVISFIWTWTLPRNLWSNQTSAPNPHNSDII